jgi:hypothetical protein
MILSEFMFFKLIFEKKIQAYLKKIQEIYRTNKQEQICTKKK